MTTIKREVLYKAEENKVDVVLKVKPSMTWMGFIQNTKEVVMSGEMYHIHYGDGQMVSLKKEFVAIEIKEKGE